MDLEAISALVGNGPSPEALLADLERLADDLADPDHGAVSARTRAAYEADFARYEDWCALHERDALPVSPALVRLYVADLATSPRRSGSKPVSAATIERHLAAIAWRSRLDGGVHDLARHPLVAPVLAGVRRRQPSTPARRTADATVVRAIIEAMSHDTWPAGVAAARDTCIILAARTARLRRSGVASLSVADLVRIDATATEDPALCLACARRRWLRLVSAHGRAPAMREVFGTGAASTWEHACSETFLPYVDPTTPAFRAVGRAGDVEPQALTDSGLAQMFQRRVDAAGLASARYAFDSLRLGQ